MGTIVYDNQMSAGDDATSLAISRGQARLGLKAACLVPGRYCDKSVGRWDTPCYLVEALEWPRRMSNSVRWP